MQKAGIVSRYLLGLIYFVFGLNGFLQFLPMPPMEGIPAQLMGGFAATGYFFPLLKGTEVLGGLALLTGMYAPLALVILAPITLNIFMFHFFLTPGQWGMAAFMVVLHGLAAKSFWAAYQPLLVARAAKSRR